MRSLTVAASPAVIAWLLARGGRAPAVYLGVLFALEIIGNFTIFDVLADLRHKGRGPTSPAGSATRWRPWPDWWRA